MLHKQRFTKYPGAAYSGFPNAHPDSPAGAGGPGRFRGASPLGINPEYDVLGKVPGALGLDASGDESFLLMTAWFGPLADASAGVPAQPATDPDIEALNLSDVAKKAAYKLKKEFPSVVFTSGRRDTETQAHAMASNVVLNRKWIKDTYVGSVASKACQKWVDDHKDKTTISEIATGLKGVLDGLTDDQLAHLSKHLSGDAFDVQPVKKDGDEIKKMLRELTKPGGKFLEKEGGLVRWHAQF